LQFLEAGSNLPHIRTSVSLTSLIAREQHLINWVCFCLLCIVYIRNISSSIDRLEMSARALLIHSKD